MFGGKALFFNKQQEGPARPGQHVERMAINAAANPTQLTMVETQRCQRHIFSMSLTALLQETDPRIRPHLGPGISQSCLVSQHCGMGQQWLASACESKLGGEYRILTQQCWHHLILRHQHQSPVRTKYPHLGKRSTGDIQIYQPHSPGRDSLIRGLSSANTASRSALGLAELVQRKRAGCQRGGRL